MNSVANRLLPESSSFPGESFPTQVPDDQPSLLLLLTDVVVEAMFLFCGVTSEVTCGATQMTILAIRLTMRLKIRLHMKRAFCLSFHVIN